MKEEEPENPPELAKFAPLITRPPKQKTKELPAYVEPSSSKKLLPPPAPAPDTVAFYIVSIVAKHLNLNRCFHYLIFSYIWWAQNENVLSRLFFVYIIILL